MLLTNCDGITILGGIQKYLRELTLCFRPIRQNLELILYFPLFIAAARASASCSVPSLVLVFIAI